MITVLYQPEIPQNTGNIVRTCSVTNTDLVLVTPLGFDTSDKYLKRAGLDYWDEVKITYVDDLISFIEKENKPFYFLSSKVKKSYTTVSYTEDTMIIFGSETKGLPEELFERYPEQFVTIPMKEDVRCLNLSNSANIVLYEGLRQLNFPF